MLRTSRILILLLVVVLGFGGPAFAADKAIIVSGQETPGDSGTITISFSDSAGHNYSESVAYGQYSTSASIASVFWRHVLSRLSLIGLMRPRCWLYYRFSSEGGRHLRNSHDHLPIHLIFSSGIRVKRDNGISAYRHAVHRL